MYTPSHLVVLDESNTTIIIDGDPYISFKEHPVRILLVLKVSITRELDLDNDIWYDLAIHANEYKDLLSKKSNVELIKHHLNGMFDYNPIATITLLDRLPLPIKEGIFANISLNPTNLSFTK